MDLNAIWARLLRVLKLEPGVFEEVGQDEKATGEAFVIAIAASLIGGISSIGGEFGSGVGGWIFGAIIGAPLGLLIGTGILFLVGKLFKGQGEYIQLLRGLGYASGVNAASIVPFIGGLVAVVYGLILAIRAVQEINRVSQGAAIATVLIPAAIVFVLVLFIAIVAGIAFLGMAAANS